MERARRASEVKAEEPLKLLIIDDEPNHAEAVAESLERIGYECLIATSGSQGARLIDEEEPDLILTDLKMDDLDGLAIVGKAKKSRPEVEVVVITGHGDVQKAVAAMKAGAANFLEKPVNLTDLRTVVDRVAERLKLTKANRELQQQLDEKFGFEGVVGNSPKMHEVIAKLKSVAPTAATVLIVGETGTGKELVAKAIHNNSPRKNKHFVAMNCTALNENLLEDELFGHEVGAFTGAERLRKGRFEHAHGGTLFLDEVGDMPLTLQAKLLRVLENQEVMRIGSNDPIKVNVRLLSATNRDLEAAVAAGTFRRDLYFRLKVVTIRLPPLRERRDDIPLLTAHFIKEMNQRHGKQVGDRPAEPINRALAGHDWPGNVRELRNLIESMVVQDQDSVLGLDDIQDSDFLQRLPVPEMAGQGSSNLVGRSLQEVERYYMEQALVLTKGNREEAARLLGIGERTLYRMIQNWKKEDQIRAALKEVNGDLPQAAALLGVTEKNLGKLLKKWGVQQPEPS